MARNDIDGKPVNLTVNWKHDLLVRSKINSNCYFTIGEFKPGNLHDFDKCVALASPAIGDNMH